MDGAPQSQDTKLILTPPPQTGTGVSTPPPPANPSAWKGRRVKRFKLVDELGEGAMGRVYVAEDTVLKRHVALKLLPAKHRDGRTNHRTERLVREARSAASLEHPNAVVIYEIDEAGGVHYIAMEYVEGGNLEKLVQLSGPLEIERACQLIAEAAEACHHAHRRGIIHRDIKPANLLLTRNGRCKVADFGLAAFDAPDDPHRLKCVGTPNFIPPEIALARGAVPQSDIYSLGCTLWYLLTGRPPFSGSSTRDVLKLHVKEPLPDLRKWRPDAPDRLVQAVQQACAKDPAKRFPDADTFAKVMRTFTIQTQAVVGAGSNGGAIGGGVPVASGPAMSGYVMMSGSGGHMQPVNALSNVPIGGPAMSGEVQPQRKWNFPAGAMWAVGGMAATAALIALGVFLAGQRPNDSTAAAGPVAPVQQAATPQQTQPAPGSAVASIEGAVEAPPAPAVSATPVVLTVATPPAGENLFGNGSLDEPMVEQGVIPGWYVAERCKPMVQTLEEGSNRFMRVKNTDPTTTQHADQKIDVDPTWKSVTISARLRASNFKAGKKGASGVSFSFQDDNEKLVGRYPPPLLVTEDTPWVNRVVTVDIPPGAKKLYLQCVVSYAKGTIDFDDVKLVAAK